MSDGSATVSVELLRKITNQALDHARAVGGDEIDLESDYFWSISPDDMYDVYTPPEDLTIGQVTESWETLAEQDVETVTSYTLVWIADVLRALGHQLQR